MSSSVVFSGHDVWLVWIWFTRREDFKYFTSLRQEGERTFSDFSVKNFLTAPIARLIAGGSSTK
jgi:hypothetical protein